MAKTVRYVNTTSGTKVRSSAAGTEVRTIGKGTLVIHDSVNAPVVASLNGTSYTWIKVTYFYPNVTGGKNEIEATGWIARENTATVPTSAPAKSSIISRNGLLLENEMLNNVRYIYKYLKTTLPSAKRWTSSAIGGLVGNIEVESTFSPELWEVNNDTTKGYGLVQWTPATKYINWLPSGADKKDIDKQLERLQYEVDTADPQWSKSGKTPQITFKEFSQMTGKGVKELADYFLKCYERPGNYSVETPRRENLAFKWNLFMSALGEL